MEVWERTTGSQEWALNIEWGAGKVYVRASLTWSANELCSGRLKKWYCSRLKWRCEFYQGNHRVQEKAQINEWRDVTPLWKCLRLQYKPPSCPCVYQQWAMREESRMKKNKKSGHIDSDPGPAEMLCKPSSCFLVEGADGWEAAVKYSPMVHIDVWVQES